MIEVINMDGTSINYKANIREVYSKENDITFIMRDEFLDDEVIRIECIAWYCGEPNNGDTKYFIKKPSTIANFK